LEEGLVDEKDRLARETLAEAQEHTGVPVAQSLVTTVLITFSVKSKQVYPCLVKTGGKYVERHLMMVGLEKIKHIVITLVRDWTFALLLLVFCGMVL
jgi:hypothetical protein